MDRRIVVYDTEISREVKHTPGGWDNPAGMGFASAVGFDYSTDRYEFFLGPEHLEDFKEFLHGAVCISFNGVKFDSRLILGNNRLTDPIGDGLVMVEGQTGTGTQTRWYDYDLLLLYVQAKFGLADVGEAEKKLGDKAIHDGSFGLDGLAEGTFGLRKTGHGAKAPILYQEGRYAELLAYNLQDVRLTKKLFDFIQANGFVVDRDDRVVRKGVGVMGNEIQDVLEILDKINTIAEGTPKEPFAEIYKLSGDAIKILREYKQRRGYKHV